MPAEFRVDAHKGVVFTTAWGVLSTEDVLAGREVLGNDPQFLPDMKQLIDMRGVTAALAHAEVKSLALSDPFVTGARRAVVAPGDLAFGVMRQYAAYLFNKAVVPEVFRGLDEACEWLGIDCPE